MKFGNTYQYHNEKRQARLKKLHDVRIRRFAYLPAKTYTGVWVWLDYVYLDYNVYIKDGKYKKVSFVRPVAHITKDGVA